MKTEKLHADEVDTSVSLVIDLLSEQYPQWGSLPVRPVGTSGTDNKLFRLGTDLVVRLPRIEGADGQIFKDQRWLPEFAPRLPVLIPEQVAIGQPTDSYPFNWSVYKWIGGEAADIDSLTDSDQTAEELARFIKSLRSIDPSDGPADGYRGKPIRLRDGWTRESINGVKDLIDPKVALSFWDKTIEAADWSGPPTWFHGDLMPGNILLEDGKLKAIIDFGVLGVGDPAVDLIVAWFLLPIRSRPVFRAAMGVSEDEWLRGRGWALSIAAGYIPYYKHTTLPGVAYCKRALRELMEEASND